MPVLFVFFCWIFYKVPDWTIMGKNIGVRGCPERRICSLGALAGWFVHDSLFLLLLVGCRGPCATHPFQVLARSPRHTELTQRRTFEASKVTFMQVSRDLKRVPMFRTSYSKSFKTIITPAKHPNNISTMPCYESCIRIHDTNA